MTEVSTPPPGKSFLRLKEAAAILGVSETFMRNVLSGRRGPNKPRAVRLGSNWRIPTAEFMDWVNRQTDRWPSSQKEKRCS